MIRSTHADVDELQESALDLYENAPCGYLSTDPDGLIVRVNRTFLDWTGYRPEDLVGVKRFQDLLTAGGRIYHETHFAPLLRMQGAVREIAVDLVRADGRRLPALVNSVLKRSATGDPVLVRTTIFDATDRKRYEQELLAARDRERIARERIERLQGLTVAVAAAPDAEAIADAVMGELVAGLAADRAGFALHDGSPEGFRLVLAHGSPELPPPALDESGAPVFDEGEPSRGEATAVLSLGAPPSGGCFWLEWDGARPFTPEERALMIACAGQASVALERARLFEEQRDVAHVLQQSMLGGALPEDPRFEIAAHYNPAGENLEVGGDWFDAFAVPGGRIGIVVGDVVGRGLAAASAMGQLRSAVRALAGAELGPAGLLTRLDTFVEQIPAAQYATLAYAEIDPDTGQTTLASAGHLPLLLFGGELDPEWVMKGRSQPLGIPMAQAPRPQAEIILSPGSGFLLFTDGLVERRGESIDDGLERLLAVVRDLRDGSPTALVGHAARTLLSDELHDDDVCLLCLKRPPGGRPAGEGS